MTRFFSRRFWFLQGGYFIFSFSSVFLKLASYSPLFSKTFFLYYAGSLFCVFAFAILWQQVLREYELMTAYAWRGILFLWTFLWAIIFFGESVTLNNFIGAFIIFFGVILVVNNE